MVNKMQYEIWHNYGNPSQDCIHLTFSYKDAMRQLTKAKEKYNNIDLLTVDPVLNVYWIGDSMVSLPIEEEESCFNMS